MTTRQRHLRITAVTCLAVFALFTSACSDTSVGGGDGGGKKTAGTIDGSGASADARGGDVTGNGAKSDEALEQRKCLREQGLEVQEPKPGQDSGSLAINGEGVSKEKMQKAMEACAGKGGPGAAREMTQADKDKALKYARCMRKNGVDMPDPKFDGSGQKAQPAPKSGPEKTRFEKAMKTCGGES